MTDLTAKRCIPCERGTPPLTKEKIEEYKKRLESEWEVVGGPPSHKATDGHGKKIRKEFKFRNFVAAMEFVNKVADLAEQEGHHPDFVINYNRVTLELTTHAIGGLSENDFVLAAKIERLQSAS